MIIVKRIAKGIAILVGVVVLAGVVFVASDWRFYKRLATFDPTTSMTNMAWYEPSVEVKPGTSPEIPVAPKDARTLSDDLVNDLEAYAEDN